MKKRKAAAVLHNCSNNNNKQATRLRRASLSNNSSNNHSLKRSPLKSEISAVDGLIAPKRRAKLLLLAFQVKR